MIYNLSTKDHTELSLVGYKAMSLIKMTNGGFIVPEGIVLSVDFFKEWIDTVENSIEWKDYAKSPSDFNYDRLVKVLSSLSLTEDRIKLLEDELSISDRYGANIIYKTASSHLYAIRSSPLEKNMESGIYKNILGVKREDLQGAIKEVFLSSIDRKAINYKIQNNMIIRGPRIAVIIQKQIDSDLSGLGFSINPDNKSYDELMIKSKFGLGKSIVKDDSKPDTYIVNKYNNEIIKKVIGEKNTSLWLNEKGGLIKRSNFKKKEKSLTDAHVIMVSRLICQCERHYELPVKIEWAFEDDKLYFLQARPIRWENPLPDEMLTNPDEPQRLYLSLSALSEESYDSSSILGQDIWRNLILRLQSEIFFKSDSKIISSIYGRHYLDMLEVNKLFGNSSVNGVFECFNLPVKIILGDESLQRDFPYIIGDGSTSSLYKDILNSSLLSSFNKVYSLLKPYKSLEKYKSIYRDSFSYIKDEIRNMDYLDEIFEGAINKFTGFTKANAMLYPLIRNYLELLSIFEEEDVRCHLINIISSLEENPFLKSYVKLENLLMHDEIRETKDGMDFLYRFNNNEYSSGLMKELDDFFYRYSSLFYKGIDISYPRIFEEKESFYLILKSFDKKCLDNIRENKFKSYSLLYNKAKNMGMEKKFESIVKIVMALGPYKDNLKNIYLLMIDELRNKVMEISKEFLGEGRLDNKEDIFNLTLEQITKGQKNRHVDLRILIEENHSQFNLHKDEGKLPEIISSRGKIYNFLRDNNMEDTNSFDAL